MFKDAEIFASFAVDNLEKAKEFYSETLGLNVTEMSGMLQLKFANGSAVMVYPKPDHAAANFTVLNIPVDDIEPAMDELIKKGVHFEIYTGEGNKTDDKGVSAYGTMKAAWFKDPAGNLVALLEGL